jgi:hypothetical protein
MLKALIASSAVVGSAVLASPAAVKADVYYNPEINIGVGSDSGLGAAVVDAHVGYKFENGAYVQAGPAIILPDQGSTELQVSGKAGMSSGPIYGEVSFMTGDDETGVNIKVGAVF